MNDYKPVPVDAARQIAAKFDKSMVVILCFDRVHQLTHTTTYGITAVEKEQAAAAGELCTQAIGGNLNQKCMFEDFHNDYRPALLREAHEIFSRLVSEWDVPHGIRQQVDRWLEDVTKPEATP